jgi:hypothetical protein
LDHVDKGLLKTWWNPDDRSIKQLASVASTSLAQIQDLSTQTNFRKVVAWLGDGAYDPTANELNNMGVAATPALLTNINTLWSKFERCDPGRKRDN